MLQNIKVDIIYYLTNTDFEMEFNLCGCCRMRLLTDRATDRKSFVSMLSRAVSRSKIIISCGGLFSETGLIETVATAIGKKTALADNKAFGIKGDHKINIIEGSVPLVTPDGFFGGCIIESGPQTIILLSENKSVRKTIMQKLIHPYIEEYTIQSAAENPSGSVSAAVIPGAATVTETISAVEPEKEEAEKEPEKEPENEGEGCEEQSAERGGENSEDTADIISEADSAENEEKAAEEIDAEIKEEEKEEEKPVDPTQQAVSEEDPEKSEEISEDATLSFVFDSELPQEAEIPLPPMVDIPDDEIPMHLVPEKVKYSKTNYYDVEYTTSEEDEMFISQTSAVKHSPAVDIPIKILSVLAVLLFVVLAYLLVVLPIMHGYSLPQYFGEIFAKTAQISHFL